MAKEAGPPHTKEGGRKDSTEPGTIVAGPDAHAREGAGKTPPDRAGKSKNEPANDCP
jgi:hypothetical protein